MIRYVKNSREVMMFHCLGRGDVRPVCRLPSPGEPIFERGPFALPRTQSILVVGKSNMKFDSAVYQNDTVRGIRTFFFGLF